MLICFKGRLLWVSPLGLVLHCGGGPLELAAWLNQGSWNRDSVSIVWAGKIEVWVKIIPRYTRKCCFRCFPFLQLCHHQWEWLNYSGTSRQSGLSSYPQSPLRLGKVLFSWSLAIKHIIHGCSTRWLIVIHLCLSRHGYVSFFMKLIITLLLTGIVIPLFIFLNLVDIAWIVLCRWFHNRPQQFAHKIIGT